MQKSLGFLIVCILSIAQFSAAADAKKKFHWPEKIKAAVSLSYDDALDTQLDIAMPTLNKYNIKGTFYLALAYPPVTNRLPEWRAAAEQGHELGNHTLFHQCSKALPDRDWVKPQNDLDKTNIAQLKDQIMLGNSMLYAIDGKKIRTFTVPCGDLKAGGENYLDAIKSEFVAIKAIAGDAVTPDMNKLDPYFVIVYTPHDITGKELIAMVKAAAKKGTMINFTFHGVGGDYLTTSQEAHDELVKYLADNRNIYWTDTFLNIMQYVKTQQK